MYFIGEYFCGSCCVGCGNSSNNIVVAVVVVVEVFIRCPRGTLFGAHGGLCLAPIGGLVIAPNGVFEKRLSSVILAVAVVVVLVVQAPSPVRAY